MTASFTRLVLILVGAAVVAVLQAAPDRETAHAAFPGGNGKIAFVTYSTTHTLGLINTVNPDGTDLRTLGPGSQPAWSPDGRKLAFVTGGGAGGIAVMDADGTNRVSISADGEAPDWSPDGKDVAFIRQQPGSNNQLWVMRADGSSPRQLTHPPVSLSGVPPSWSPDGTEIVFSAWAPPDTWNLFSVSPAGGAPVNITNGTDGWERAPDWAPDGQRIAFAVLEDQPFANNIWVASAGGGGRQRLTSDAGPGNSNPAWSPDGTKIAFNSITPPQVYVMDAGGGNRRLLVDGADPDWQPVPATKVEFTQGIQVLQSISDLQESLSLGQVQPMAAAPRGNGKLLVLPVATPYQLASVAPDGSDFRILADGMYGNWSPDGSKIAFSTEAGDISVMEADGSGVTPILSGPTHDYMPSWSPDGERIAFWRFHDGESEIFTARADGTDVTQLTDWSTIRALGYDTPKWSPDGSKILFVGRYVGSASPGWELYTLPAGGGVPTQLTNIPSYGKYAPEWSPDGTKIAFGQIDSGIMVMNAAGGAATKIATMALTGLGAGPVWSPDGERIAYTEMTSPPGTAPHTFASYVMDTNGGNKQTIPVGGIIQDWQPVPATKVEFTQGIQVLQSISDLQESLSLGQVQPMAAAAAHGNGKLLVRDHDPFNFRLASVETDGSDFRFLGGGFYGSWSPDGSRIAFDTQFLYPDVSIMDADGSNVTPVATTGSGGIMPTWSPDGERIAFIGWTGPSAQGIFTIKADGTGMVQLTDWDTVRIASDSAPKWSPDGSRIVFMGQLADGGGWDLFTVPAAGGGLTRLTNLGHALSTPEWSPDGTKIAFLDQAESAIKVMAAGGGAPSTVATMAYTNVDSMGPVWSPDGKRIAYTERTSAPGVVPWTFASYVMDVNGGNKQAIPIPNNTIVLDWQPVPATKVEFTQAAQQLQSISALQADLKGDGKPPVPIVAGKPMAMRVLFGEVQQVTTYSVEVSGEFTGSEPVTLKPGCTLVQRRRQEGGCKSVDFYFTPPAGNWSVTLKVKEAGKLVEEHEFNLTSEETDDVVLKAVSLCDAKAPGFGGLWQCQDPSGLFANASLLRRMLPAANVSVVMTGDRVRREVSLFAQPIQWWGQVNHDLQAMYGVTDALAGLFGQETYYFGIARTAVPGGTLGAAYVNTRAAAAKSSYTNFGYEAIPWVNAHELGHAMGLDHTNTSLPPIAGNKGCWLGSATNLAWPYADNLLRSGPAPGAIEVGFDVGPGKVALPGDDYYDFSGYCTSPPPAKAADATVWISPFNALQLMEPTGPLSVSPMRPAAVPSGAPADYWLVQGEIDAQGQASFDPLLTFELEGAAPATGGTHRLEVLNASSGVLYTRTFTPSHGHGSPSPGDPVLNTLDAFSELIPVQPGATLIQLFDGFNMPIGSITLGGQTPQVNITQASNDGATVTVQWSVTDPDSTEHTYWVDYSPDGGQTWQNQAIGLTEPGVALDAATLAGSDNAVVRVIASDGVNSGQAVSEPFTVAGKLPHGEIIAPEGGPSRARSLVWLQAAAWDIDDGTLDGPAVTWSSSLDGALGEGASLPVYDLSVGDHVITMTATDSDNNVVTDSITVTVFDGPIVEEPAGLSGDVDCSGDVDPADALRVLQHLSGTGQLDCAAADVDCSGAVTVVDTLFVLRHAATLPVNLPGGCREIGT